MLEFNYHLFSSSQHHAQYLLVVVFVSPRAPLLLRRESVIELCMFSGIALALVI